MVIAHRIYRWIVFKIGDTRWCGWKHFPFILTWDVVEPKLTGDELMEVVLTIRRGDVLLMRSDGYASNLGIGTTLIHAALVVNNSHVVEALSDDQGGVVERHVLDCIRHADRLVIVRPELYVGINDAVNIAKELVGLKYDIYFKFDVANQRKQLAAGDRSVRICCTEVPYFAYIDQAEQLGLFKRVKKGLVQWLLKFAGIVVGDHVLTADDILTAEKMRLVWASKSAGHEWFKSITTDERILFKVTSFRK